MAKRSYIRRASWVLGGILLLLPILVWGAAGSMTRVQNAPAFWLPEYFAERQNFTEFSRRFGILDSVLVSWAGCTADDPRLLSFAERLRQLKFPRENRPAAPLFPEVLTGYEAVRQLMDEPLRLTRESALRRLQGVLVGQDGISSCALVMLSPEAGQDREKTIAILREAARNATGLADDQIFMAGSIIDGAVVDRESVRVMTVYGLPAAILSLLVCYLCLRSWIQTLAVVAVATIGQGLVLALVWYSGLTMNAVLAVMAPLVFVVTISGGIHLSNYFIEQWNSKGAKDPVAAALAAGWVPCLIAALTTAIGTFSLVASQIVPVRHFGVIASVGILVCLALLFLVLPGAMEARIVWATVRGRRRTAAFQGLRGPHRWPLRGLGFGFSHFSGWNVRIWEIWGRTVVRHWCWLLLVCAVAIGVTGLGIPRLRTSVNVRNLLVPESPVLAQYRLLEERIGPLVPVELVVRFDPTCPLDILQRVELIRRLEAAMREVPEVGGVLSAASFLPAAPAGGGARSTFRRTVFKNRLEANLDELARAHWFARDELGQWWRISARLPAFSTQDYAVHLDEIEKRVHAVLASGSFPGVHIIPTGLTVLVEKAQQALLQGMLLSFLSAFLIVAIVLAVVLRGVATSAVAMVPNIFPSVLVFGLLGLQDVRIDLGSVMTASIALGIAVDGTVHYLTWFQRELDQGASIPQAVRGAFHHCAWAMVQATLVCVVGFLLFAGSSFLPMRRFATTLAQLLIAALVGDLVLLPALLMSPVGYWLFARKTIPEILPVAPCVSLPVETVSK